ncbi:MAG TPA: PSD1 and planctomycete cytochrome C domain-containing protein [Planctomycetota bacterium]|nr:PSD1 and planctomycete cytochrome C domain-containing protein [Planctomycetota bacterium]
MTGATLSKFAAAAVFLLGTAPAQERSHVPPAGRVEFNRDIRPILSDMCFRCHGPDKGSNASGLRLDTREGLFGERPGGGRAVVPGKPAESELWKRISSRDRDVVMPPPDVPKKLSRGQIALLKRWIEEGAPWEGHWAYLPPRRPPVPKVRDASSVRNAIDAFILARLEREGLAPSPEADRVTLLRRLSFDLVGLPPEIEEVDAFRADRSEDAYEKQVERLLASPHYGERMAIFWLDIVRYGNSRGYHSDNPRRVDPYRDYVIQAFNENMPFDRFTVEQLAGDLLPEPALRQRVASCFNKLNLTTEEGGAQAKEYEHKTNADRVRALGTVWLGATLGCAECHDHKFDPFTMRDFYSLAAFFADIREAPIGDRDEGILVPSSEEEAELRRLDEEIARARRALETVTPEIAAAQEAWEKSAGAADPWTVLRPSSLRASGKATLTLREDGSVAAGGENPDRDTYTVEVEVPFEGATGLRLEALADPSLPASGPGRADNGNFVLTRFSVRAGGKEIPLREASATHAQEGYPVAGALDKKAGSGWAILPHAGRNHAAAFEFKEPLPAGVKKLTVTLEYASPFARHAIGRFRLSATAIRHPARAGLLPDAVKAALAVPAAARTPEQKARVAAHYRAIAPELEPLRAELARAEKARADFVKKIPTCLVSEAAPPRTVRIRPRGNWMDDSGEIVLPATPKFLPPLGVEGRRATRLDLARWLVAPENPLTARVFVNRLWRLFFGMGLSRSLDDLGAQSEWPVHPELLDWLAVEFMESGWDVKHLVRLIVTSRTYRQTSVPRPELKERDPFNRLLARQSRWRLDAELVRDNALAVSGLLVRRIGGPSVFPYQPKGYWAFLNFPAREWPTSTGADLWRRGVYTWWQRTFPHPSLVAFDAPQREECCAERPRSNIPQQALALLNDPTYVEAARAFAERILRRGGSGDEDRLAWAFRCALSRPPASRELEIMAGLLRKHRAEYAADPKAAESLIRAGASPVPRDLPAPELAAWTSVARALLNLHETITRN